MVSGKSSAPATTGPARHPRPTSSMPKTETRGNPKRISHSRLGDRASDFPNFGEARETRPAGLFLRSKIALEVEAHLLLSGSLRFLGGCRSCGSCQGLDFTFDLGGLTFETADVVELGAANFA